jgi:hypothetical protein
MLAAVRFGRDLGAIRWLGAVLLLDLLFSAVKRTVHDEPEAVVFARRRCPRWGEFALAVVAGRRAVGPWTTP